MSFEILVKSLVFCINLGGIQFLLHIKDGFLAVLQQNVQTTDNCHRQDNITIFSSHIHITQAVISNSPYKTHDCIVNLIVHVSLILSSYRTIFVAPKFILNLHLPFP